MWTEFPSFFPNSGDRKIVIFYLSDQIDHLSMVEDVTPYLLNRIREDDDPPMSSRVLDCHPTEQNEHR
jgi:hypothetical protein